jgi:hypothetical protein
MRTLLRRLHPPHSLKPIHTHPRPNSTSPHLTPRLLHSPFQRLERGGVDDELAKMKRNVLSPAPQVEDELSKMKKLMASEGEADKAK